MKRPTGDRRNVKTAAGRRDAKASRRSPVTGLRTVCNLRVGLHGSVLQQWMHGTFVQVQELLLVVPPLFGRVRTVEVAGIAVAVDNAESGTDHCRTELPRGQSGPPRSRTACFTSVLLCRWCRPREIGRKAQQIQVSRFTRLPPSTRGSCSNPCWSWASYPCS